MWWDWINFTCNCVLIGEREIGGLVVGNKISRRGWPPKEINNISDNRFNNLHWINNERNFQIQKWIHNIFHNGDGIPYPRRDSHEDPEEA